MLALLVVFTAGCRDRSVTEHIVEKGVEQVPPPATPPTAPPTTQPGSQPAASTAPGTDPNATTEPRSAETTLPAPPAGWVLDPEPRPMRLATYIVTDPPIEVAVTRFPGRVGGTLANINRWRGQMGLGPVEAGDLASVLTVFEGPGYEGYETRIESDAGVMLASGVYEAGADQTWFVRTTTTSEAADRAQAAVFGFGRSIMNPGSRGSD